MRRRRVGPKRAKENGVGKTTAKDAVRAGSAESGAVMTGGTIAVTTAAEAVGTTVVVIAARVGEESVAKDAGESAGKGVVDRGEEAVGSTTAVREAEDDLTRAAVGAGATMTVKADVITGRRLRRRRGSPPK